VRSRVPLCRVSSSLGLLQRGDGQLRKALRAHTDLHISHECHFLLADDGMNARRPSPLAPERSSSVITRKSQILFGEKRFCWQKLVIPRPCVHPERFAKLAVGISNSLDSSEGRLPTIARKADYRSEKHITRCQEREEMTNTPEMKKKRTCVVSVFAWHRLIRFHASGLSELLIHTC